LIGMFGIGQPRSHMNYKTCEIGAKSELNEVKVSWHVCWQLSAVLEKHNQIDG
jgi:hypothetical protein